MNNFDCFIYNNGGMFLDLRLNYLNKYIDKSIIVVPKYKFLLKFWGLIGKKSMILVTGSAGYLGSHICKKLLDKNIPFYSIDNLSSGKFENVFRKGFFKKIDYSSKQIKKLLLKKKNFHNYSCRSIYISKRKWKK